MGTCDSCCSNFRDEHNMHIYQELIDMKHEMNSPNDHESDCVESIIELLKCLQKVDTENDVKGKGNLIETCYGNKNLLDDCIELIQKYNDSLENLHDTITDKYSFRCSNIKKCKSFIRYNRNMDRKHEFYIDLLDGMHCYLLHSWDVGLRVKSSDITDDKYFSHVKSVINKKKYMLKKIFGNNITRFDGNKFNANMTNNYKNTKHTFLDELHERINDDNDRYVFQFEEYDTESILYIMGVVDDTTSNIFDLVYRDSYDAITGLVRQYNIEKHSFSIGFSFYYWDHYRTNPIDENKQHYANRIDFFGYQPHELFIQAKYEDLKQEIQSNKIMKLGVNDYHKAINKCNKLFSSQKAKSLKAAKYADNRLHFNITDDASILEKHILSVILYCDYNELQKAFTSTFRKIRAFESLESVKMRHCEFVHFAKCLREAVEYYGYRGKGDRTKMDRDFIYMNQVSGPFFCGIKELMSMPEFNIRLNGPTSTSKQIEVATRFAKSDGIIIEFNNNGHCNASRLRMFPCKWLSDYHDEDEYLLIGGQYQIKIQSIRTMESNSSPNYKLFCCALFNLDCMIKGTTMDEENIGEDDYMILNDLINYKLKKPYANKYVQYIRDTFDVFTDHRTLIVLNLYELNNHFSELKNLLIDNGNLFHPNIFNLFSNVNHIIIYSTNHDGKQQYDINLLELLSIIDKPIVLKKDRFRITLKATRKRWNQKQKTWLCTHFNEVESKLYNKNYSFILKETKNNEKMPVIEDCLLLEKNN
eukprot:248810_1